MDDDRRIAPVAEVPADGSLCFRVRDADGAVREAILVAVAGDETTAHGPGGGGVRGYLNQCQHFTHVPLDKGSGAPRRNGELVCANHGAMFDVATGRCTHGPCEGAFLAPVDVAVRDGDVHLTDESYALVGRGPVERDPAARSSTSNVEF